MGFDSTGPRHDRRSSDGPFSFKLGRIASLAIVLAFLLAAGPASAQSQRVPGDCPPSDLTVVLNTGWDQSTSGATIPIGGFDDDWDVTLDASGGTVPRDAEVITPNPAWVTLPNSEWISAAKTGPNGTYVYEMCWCMDDDAVNPVLDFEIRADDAAEIFLNGSSVATLPDGTFNDTIAPAFTITDPTLFVVGVNCLEVEVENKYGVVTGMNLAGTVTADDGMCCGCDPEDSDEELSTGYDDSTGAPIPPGTPDDEWTVIVDPSGGAVPRPAGVVNPNPAWDTLGGTRWISAALNGPNGTYVYENCWCLNEFFTNPLLSIAVLADDNADIYLNGNFLFSTPSPGFSFPAAAFSFPNPGLFQPGENCLQIHVNNTQAIVTGLDVSATFTATDGECCDCVPLPPDAEGWWPLNETSGTTAAEIFNGHDGTHSEIGISPPLPQPTGGYVAGALLFDGVDDWVNVPDDPGLDFGPGEDLSIDAWVQTTNLTRMVIVNKRKSFFDPGYSFYVGGGVMTFEMRDGANVATCVGATPLNDGDWHFVAVTLDRSSPTGIRLFLDGAIDQTCDPTAVPGDLSNAEPFYIGGDPLHPNGVWWDGPLDEIELFRRALAITEVEDLFLAGNAGKCPPEPCEDSSGLPVCEGACDLGFECVQGPAGGPPCSCEPEEVPCGDAELPQCEGICPIGQVCGQNPVGACECQDFQPNQCSQYPYPQCNGPCPQGTGECQPIPGTQFCDCVLPPPCEDSLYPTCGGDCPAGLFCTQGPAQDCYCEQEPHCGDAGDYPTCNEPCPPGFTCEILAGAQACFCKEDNAVCGDTFYPECDGNCPQNQSCKNLLGTDECECVDDKPACGDPLYPECNGSCPDDEVCVSLEPQGIQGCECQSCVVVGPGGGGGTTGTGVGIDIKWKDKSTLRWSAEQCALTYNTYRQTLAHLDDLDGDGLADSYGTCFQSDIIGRESPDPSLPQPRQAHWYLITGENFVGEGSLGTNSSRVERPNTSACP